MSHTPSLSARPLSAKITAYLRVSGLLLLLLTLLSGCAGLRASDPRVPWHPFTRFHKPFFMAEGWKLTPLGVQMRWGGIERTEGKPRTVTWIWENHFTSINRWANHYKVPAELIIALIATESAPARGAPFYTRDPRSLRREKGFSSLGRTPGRISVGLTQITIATARATLALEGIESTLVDDGFLMNPDNGIRAGTALVARQARGELCNIATLLDPPVVFAAYNAGGMYRMGGFKNRWKMKQFPLRTGVHVDRGIKYLNDAIAVLRTHRYAPSYGWKHYVYNPPTLRASAD